MIIDELERKKALDPTLSFIVQAPAGSGKTELLTQRFLVLLSTVNQPEEILAITFTKKSAAEMRTRIIKALKNAKHKPMPEQEHAKKTWQLAQQVLNKDAEKQWNLLQNPNRLRLQTIDSFNASLTKQLPLLSHFGASPDLVEDAFPLYREAVQEFLSHLEENVAWSDAIATLLIHMDNNLAQVEELLIHMLAKRDQWLPHITFNASDPLLKQTLEAYLADIVLETLAKLVSAFPPHLKEELLYLARYAASNLPLETYSPILMCKDITTFPCPILTDLPVWHGLAELLFKKSDYSFRKRWDKTLGFPSADQFKNPVEKIFAKEMKERIQCVATECGTQESLCYALSEFFSLPQPIYETTQWETLSALHIVLRVLVAQLKVIFQQKQKIDFIENSQAALLALGSDEIPTDLTLALDYQIKHILIDEFQDTANNQYRLLEKITTGWQPHDGRTLFVVGDPMQSIYRFREAEVGLFIRAKQRGLGNIPLIPLTLSVNFRSSPTIINWVNANFSKVFPSYDDMTSGAVTFSPSTAANDDYALASKVQLHASLENVNATDNLIHLIKQCQADHPEDKIAILVRSRNHLINIIPALKLAGIPYRAIDIDPLIERPFIQDLIALTTAMHNPAARIAWLAILRAPWCGLTLSDLLRLTGSDPTLSLWNRLSNPEVIALLSEDGKNRLQRILPLLQQKMFDRCRYSWAQWIESTWVLLGGPACLSDESELNDAKTYFNLLAKMELSAELFSVEALKNQVKKLYASPDANANDSLQIMTIHNSKGLEFDIVILPELQRKSAHDDKQLLLWMERPRATNNPALILAPVHAIGEERDSIYEYIKYQQKIKNEFEQCRLLYVAVTRAKKQLHLFFTVNQTQKEIKPNNNSLLEKLWPAISNVIPLENSLLEKITSGDAVQDFSIKRLATAWINPITEIRLPDSRQFHHNKFGFLLPENQSQIIGTIIHRLLQQIALSGMDWWKNQLAVMASSLIPLQLRQAGIHRNKINLAVERIIFAVENMLSDEKGQWILHPHAHHAVEFALTHIEQDNFIQLVIDRTFVDEKGIRWIIDYKTSENNKAEMELFLQSEFSKYKEKMHSYYQAFKNFDHRPIHLGLYFPMVKGWYEWEF